MNEDNLVWSATSTFGAWASECPGCGYPFETYDSQLFPSTHRIHLSRCYKFRIFVAIEKLKAAVSLPAGPSIFAGDILTFDMATNSWTTSKPSWTTSKPVTFTWDGNGVWTNASGTRLTAMPGDSITITSNATITSN